MTPKHVAAPLSIAVSRRRTLQWLGLMGLGLGVGTVVGLGASGVRADTHAGLAVEGFDEGIDFRAVPRPTTPAVAEGRIEVVEVFWYGCPHCHAFQPTVGPWIEALPEDVAFRHVPAPFNPLWALHARAFYAAQALGILDDFHPAMFGAIHDQRRNLSTVSAVARFATVFGVSREDFEAAMLDPSVDAQLAADLAELQDWGIEGVPSLVVDGRYLISAGMAGSHGRMLEIADALIDARRQAAQG